MNDLRYAFLQFLFIQLSVIMVIIDNIGSDKWNRIGLMWISLASKRSLNPIIVLYWFLLLIIIIDNFGTFIFFICCITSEITWLELLAWDMSYYCFVQIYLTCTLVHWILSHPTVGYLLLTRLSVSVFDVHNY
jgi:hypothetical protein